MSTTQSAAGQNINKARLNPGRQWVGIRNLEFIEEVQPRAGLDRGWVNDLSKFRLEGSEFPPIKVFQTPDGRLIPGEGHHRSMAMASAGEDQILCDVVDGTMEDAIVFAAGSNRSNGVKPMGPKDITKAVEMLLSIDAWWAKANALIGKHVGCSGGKVNAIRSRISAAMGKDIPAYVLNSRGESQPLRQPRKSYRITRRKQSSNGHTYFQSQYKGRRICGKSPDIVKARVEELISKDKAKYSIESMDGFLRGHGFLGVTSGKRLYGIGGVFHIRNMILKPCAFSTHESVPLTIGQLIGARRFLGDLTARMVVLCYPEDGPQKVIDLYRAEGFEFLTPEELAESLKASGDPGDSSSSSSPPT